MKNYRTISDLARAEIDRLREDGISVTDDEVVAINALSWEIISPSRRVGLARGNPVRCGNVWLWPLTINAREWFELVGAEMGNGERALAFAMAHPCIDLFTQVAQQIEAWGRSLQCTDDQLRTAMSIVIQQDKRDELPPIKQGDGLTLGELVQTLIANNGGTVEMWEQQCSIPYVFDMFDTLAKQNEADGISHAKQRAEKALTWYISRIRRKALK